MTMSSVKGNEMKKPSFRDIRKYYCEHCGVCRSKKSLLRSHILSQHMDKLQEVMLDEVSAFKAAKKVQHACEECGARFWKPAHLVQHMRSHSIELLQYQDGGPPEKLHHESLNSRIISPERPFTCPVEDCYFSYRRKDHLNRHLLKHQGKAFDCPVQNCNRTFTFQGNLKRHVKELHDDNSTCEGEKQHVCEEPGCGKIFKYASRLKKHEDSHVKLECLELFCGEPQCMKPFTNLKCLKAHIQSCHKYIKCEVCGTQQLKKNFKRHKMAHEGVAKARIKCSFEGCEHTFSKKSNLNMHVKAVHEELRPFRCRTSGCQQKFPYKHVRDNHEKTHVCEQGNFLEADEQWRSRPRGGRKRQRITIETLTRKRVVPLANSSIFDNGAEYLSWLLSDNESDY